MSVKMINPKQAVEQRFHAAIEADPVRLEPCETEGNCFAYFNFHNGYNRIYFFDDTVESLSERILLDETVSAFLPKASLAGFLLQHMDPNALMVMEKLVLLWDDDEGKSPARDALEKEYSDEYAQYVADAGFLGQTWIERQVPVLNVRNIHDACRETYIPDTDGFFRTFFLESILQTLYHEFRHLFYDCNEIVPTGEGTRYPLFGDAENEIEAYGNRLAGIHLQAFKNIVNKQALWKLLEATDDYGAS